MTTAERRNALLVTAIVLSAFNLRTAVTSVGALLTQIEQSLGLTATASGVLAALPVLTFALIGALTPALSRRFGIQRSLMAALVIMTAGLILRALADNAVVFFACSVLALAGGAIGNVTMPTLVKQYFPHRLGPMSSAYTTSMAIGQTLAAGLSIRASQLVEPASWRLGIGIWALVAFLAIVPWVIIGASTRRRSAPDSAPDSAPGKSAIPAPAAAPASFLRMARSAKAWQIACYFGIQSTQVFIVFGWFTAYFQDQGLSGNEASALIAFFSLLLIPISLVVPLIIARVIRQGVLLMVPAMACLLGYVGLMTFRVAGAWLWMLLIGIGNAAFPMMLTLFGLRTREASTTAALSAFAQSAGYLIAGAGPIIVGALLGVSGQWTLPLLFMSAIAVTQMLLAVAIGRPGYVDDELVES